MHANWAPMSVDFVCERCGDGVPAMSADAWRCPCGGPWELPDGPPFDPAAIADVPSGLWRYRAQLRLPSDCPPLTLGEGRSPWLRLRSGPRVACAHYEPTGSFKARGVAVMTAWARSAAAPPLIEDSSGNAGGAVAAYAAAAGLACRVYVPASAPAAKRALLAALGAEVVPIDGPRPRATVAAQSDTDGTYCSHAWNPFFIEGIKTLAFQWWEEQAGCLPPRVYVPAGQGSLVLGLWHGFRELAAAFPELEIPRLVAVQHRTVAPLRAALDSDEQRDPAPDDIPSVADGIAIPDPVRQNKVLAAIDATGGDVVTVGNAEINEARRRLAAEGLWVEPTGAVGLAGHAVAGDDGDALIVLTGHGTKGAP